jgi:signal transduction histidine kinase
LNNPLTVILGYAALLEESTAPGPDRRGAEAIVIEGRRMKGILERLSRFSRLSTERFSSFSIADLVSDIEQFHRTDFLRHSIEFRLILQPGLPNIFGNVHQIRQGLLHAMQFAIESVIRVAPNEQKAVRVEASSEEGRVLILIAHSGNGFPHPERAFDSLSSGFNGTEATGIGLSLCAAIVREHRGQISALNYEPSGAAILIELPLS